MGWGREGLVRRGGARWRASSDRLVRLASRSRSAPEGRGLSRGGVPELPNLPSPSPAQDNFGLELAAVEAAVRKHEAIETDIVAYSGRVQAVDAVAAELAAERYHDIKRIAARQHNVARLWGFLRQMVAARRERLLVNLELQKVFQDLLYLMDWMEEMKVPAGHVRRASDDRDRRGTAGGTFAHVLSRSSQSAFQCRALSPARTSRADSPALLGLPS